MKIIKQLIRQPIKTILGIVLVCISVSLLCVCIGQSIETNKTENTIEESFTTIGLTTTKYQWEEKTNFIEGIGEIKYKNFIQELPEEISNYINELAKNRTDLVKTISNLGLASAYIPELTPDNISNYMYQHPNFGTQETMAPHKLEGIPTYSSAMLEIEISKIGEPYVANFKGTDEAGNEIQVQRYVSLELKGIIKNVISLEKGYDNPIDKTAIVSLVLSSEEELKALDLKVGSRYLIYGNDFKDGDWMLKGLINYRLKERGIITNWEDIDLSKVRLLDNDELISSPSASLITGVYEHIEDKNDPNYLNGKVNLYQEAMDWLNSITLTVDNPAYDGTFKRIYHENGSYPIIDYTRFITDENGNKVQISEEEWQERYFLPTITKLNGTVTEFLKSNNGALWAKQLNNDKINYNAFPIIGVNKLGYVSEFSRGNARIVSGREFSEDEINNGSKVCIISETLATKNNLSIGDTIKPQFYNYDYDNPNQKFISKGYGVINPYAYKYSSTTEFIDEQEEYKIIGFYRQNNPYCDVSENLYSFTPNTIFVPESSIVSDMDYSNQCFFQTLILQNGAIEDFRLLLDEAGYVDLFVYYDQSYTIITDRLMNYRDVSQKALLIGVLIYSIVLILFLMFFPTSQNKTLYIMNGLGANRKQRINQVFFSGSIILIIGTFLGMLLGMLLWNTIIANISSIAKETISLEMNPLNIIIIAIIQLTISLLLILLMAIFMSKNKGLKKRM